MALQSRSPGNSAQNLKPLSYTCIPRDVALYALSIGFKVKELQYLYEAHSNFSAFPTFAIVAAFPVVYSVPLEKHLPRYNLSQLLHGEQYLELHGPIPTSGTLITKPEIVDIQNKGESAVVILRASTTEESSGKLLAVNEFTSFVRNTGPFHSSIAPLARSVAATAKNSPPARPPDVTVEEATSQEQAALYRLNGDLNPLHIDPSAAARGGLPRPILHGLATLGIAVRHVITAHADGDGSQCVSVKARFSAPVFPGEVLATDMWLVQPGLVLFEVRVIGRGVKAVTAAAVQLRTAVITATEVRGPRL